MKSSVIFCCDDDLFAMESVIFPPRDHKNSLDSFLGNIENGVSGRFPAVDFLGGGFPSDDDDDRDYHSWMSEIESSTENDIIDDRLSSLADDLMILGISEEFSSEDNPTSPEDEWRSKTLYLHRQKDEFEKLLFANLVEPLPLELSLEIIDAMLRLEREICSYALSDCMSESSTNDDRLSSLADDFMVLSISEEFSSGNNKTRSSRQKDEYLEKLLFNNFVEHLPLELFLETLRTSMPRGS